MSLTPEQREALRQARRWLSGREASDDPEVWRIFRTVLAAFPPEEGPWRIGVERDHDPDGGPRYGVRRRDPATARPSAVESWWPTEAAARARADELNRREP